MTSTGSRDPRTFVVVAWCGVASIGLVACSRADPDAAVVRVRISDPVRYIDSRSACVVRLRPAADTTAARSGEVVDCLGPRETAGHASIGVPAGHHVVEVGQWGCPGMPGDCPDDPYDDLYRGGDQASGGTADWYCTVDLTVAGREEVALAAVGPGGGGDTTCQSTRTPSQSGGS